MPSCNAGNCSITCTGGCGCVSESVDPSNCACLCNGDDQIARFDQKFYPETHIDINVHGRVLMKLAVFLDTSFFWRNLRSIAQGLRLRGA